MGKIRDANHAMSGPCNGVSRDSNCPDECKTAMEDAIQGFDGYCCKYLGWALEYHRCRQRESLNVLPKVRQGFQKVCSALDALDITAQNVDLDPVYDDLFAMSIFKDGKAAVAEHELVPRSALRGEVKTVQ